MSSATRNLTQVFNRLREAIGNVPSDALTSSRHSLNETEFVASSFDRLDKKTIERTQKTLERALRYCQNPKLCIEKSPPCILDIIPALVLNLNSVDTEKLSSSGMACLTVFTHNITSKAKQVIALFKSPPNSGIYDVQSPQRKLLTNLTLRLSHILAELKALFSEGAYVGDRFRITKTDAGQFWANSFGTDRTVVPWTTFEHAFFDTHPIDSQLEATAIRATIDITDDGWISIFEFDVFVRLFHPWPTIVKNWNLLAISHPGYVAYWTYDDVKQRLANLMDKPGSYVFRQSCTRLGQWAIGYVTDDRRILQTIPQSTSRFCALILLIQNLYNIDLWFKH